MAAVITGQGAGMRPLFAFAAAAALALPIAARAEPAEEARSATGACLAAVIDKAPVGDVDGDDVSIRRGSDPVSCTVEVTGGQPVVVRDAVQQALDRRPEHFTPAKTRWEAGGYAARETFCNVPSRRNLMVQVTTGKPGANLVLVATVFEAAHRDPRCDRDEGLQKVAPTTPPKAP